MQSRLWVRLDSDFRRAPLKRTRVVRIQAIMITNTKPVAGCLRRLIATGGGGPGLTGRAAHPSDSYLVDSASSHMLVSKIKPCMSKYKHVIL